MKKHSKLPLLLVASTTLVTPSIVCAKQVDTNDTQLNVIQYDKVIFKSPVDGAKFEGKTIVKVKHGSNFAGVKKPTATLKDHTFDGWYKDDTLNTKWNDTDKIEPASKDTITYVYAKFKANGPSFETCTWSYLKDACTTYEASAQDAAAETAFCAMFNEVTVDKWDSTDNKWVQETINKPTTMDQFVGATKIMKVNGINHILRVIGVKHDTLANGSNKKAALTFEFKTLLSDSNGNSIACPWYWEEGEASKNYDYRKSNVYYALEHNTTYGAVDAGWYYFDTNTNAPSATKATSTQGDYYNKSVLEMLPIEPVQVIKKVVTTNSAWTSADRTKDATEYNAKIFLPTAKEIGFAARTIANKNEGEQYALWSKYMTASATASSIPLFIHKQIDTSTVKTDSTLITDGKYNETKNYAGYNETIGDTGNGSTFWLSSPAINQLNEKTGWAIRFNGGGTTQFAYDSIYPISPHFCL